MIIKVIFFNGFEMFKTTIFTNNKNQAVRLPKALSFPEGIKRVVITDLGNSRLISPEGELWDSWFDGLGPTDDFMCERDQEEIQKRENFDD